jgi:hypothetical protein
MSATDQEPKGPENIFKRIVKRAATNIGAIIVAPDVSEEHRTRLASILKGKVPVVAIKGASLLEPNVLTKIETLYEVLVMETNTMNYFAPEALLRGLKEGSTPQLEHLKLSLSPIEGFFELLNFLFPQGIAGAILTALIATENLGEDVIGKDQDLIVGAASTRVGDLDTVLVLRPARMRTLFFKRTQPLVKEIVAMPPPPQY